MTREQALNYLRSSAFSEEQIQAVVGAFTCEDAVSREEVNSFAYRVYSVNRYNEYFRREDLQEYFNNLPSVQPAADLSAYSDKLWKQAYERGKASVQPTAMPKCPPLDKDRKCHCGFCPERPRGEWIPVTYKPMTEEEKKYYEEYTNCDLTEMFDCPMPEDGQEILVSTKYGTVSADICCNDGVYGCGLENYGDWEDILAWMPMPEPYKEGESE